MPLKKYVEKKKEKRYKCIQLAPLQLNCKMQLLFTNIILVRYTDLIFLKKKIDNKNKRTKVTSVCM